MVLSQIFSGCCEKKAGLIFQSQGKFRVKMKANDISSFSDGQEFHLLITDATLTTDRTELYASGLVPLKLYWEAN